MMEDIKKYQKAEKLKKWRDQVEPIPWYFDGLENLCNRLHPKSQFLKVTDIEQISRDTKLLRFVSAHPRQLLAPFRAGQYIGLTVEINGVRTSRPYSLVSSPNQLSYYELGIKKKEGGFVSQYIFETVKVGDIFESTEPLGNLYYNKLFHGTNLVFIAGGSGCTPFVSMLRDISERDLPLTVWMLFGCLTEEDILFRNTLEDIQARRKKIKIIYILSEAGDEWSGECGFISKDKILKVVGSIENKFFYIVGNRPMYDFVLDELEALTVPSHRIAHEAFGVPDDVTQIMGWPEEIDVSDKVQIKIEFKRSGKREQKVIEASCVEPILNSLERVKLKELEINSGCRSGECALCRTKLLSGNVFVPPEVTTREADKDYNFIHPCISYPLTDIHLDLTVA